MWAPISMECKACNIADQVVDARQVQQYSEEMRIDDEREWEWNWTKFR